VKRKRKKERKKRKEKTIVATSPVKAVLEAARGQEEDEEDAEGPGPDGHVQQSHPQAVRAVLLVLVEARRAVANTVAPEYRADAGLQLRAPENPSVQAIPREEIGRRPYTVIGFGHHSSKGGSGWDWVIGAPGGEGGSFEFRRPGTRSISNGISANGRY
jgi:hypothetical protein